jgi:lambda family phage portal protein
VSDRYAQILSGLILPHDLARECMVTQMFGNHGAYRSASSRNKNTLGWVTTDGSADADTLADLPTLRRQSRDLCRNDGLPSGAIGSVVTGVVGTGIMPQSRIDYEFLGLTEDQADEWQRSAERIAMHLFNKKHFDAEDKLSFWQQQQLAFRSRLESGDVFALRRMIAKKSKALELCVQLVEADRVDTPTDLANNASIRAGIQTDANGAPEFAWIRKDHPGESFEVPTSISFSKIPFHDGLGDPMLLAVFRMNRPGQTRGTPYLAPVIELLKQLSRYTEAEIAAAVISGMFAVFITSDASTSPLTGGIPGQVNGQTVVPSGAGMQKMQSGMMVDLAPGEKIETASATRPNTAFDPFVMSILRQIGVGLEIPFEVLIKHFTASYSASRAALLDAYRFFFREREAFVESYCQPIWEWTITEAVARGILKAPGFFTNPMIRDAWLAADWVGDGMPQIDPLKEAKAAEAWNDLTVWSLQDISAQQNRDHDRTYRQVVRERKRIEQDGLKLSPAQQNQPAQAIQAAARANLIAELLRTDE